jgi:hypothetical protein
VCVYAFLLYTKTRSWMLKLSCKHGNRSSTKKVCNRSPTVQTEGPWVVLETSVALISGLLCFSPKEIKNGNKSIGDRKGMNEI